MISHKLVLLALLLVIIGRMTAEWIIIVPHIPDPHNDSGASTNLTIQNGTDQYHDEPMILSGSPAPMFHDAAVVSLGPQCAAIGKDILKKGGNAIEAAIATTICDGVVRMDLVGIGGGFVMNIYHQSEKKSYILNAKETAPKAASQDMFNGKEHPLEYGALASGIPGQLKGYQEAFKKFGSGKVTWSELFEPSIKLCQDGFPVTDQFRNSMKAITKACMKSDDKMKKTGALWATIGDAENTQTVHVDKIQSIKLTQLAETLKTIANSPKQADEFYKGSLTKQFVDDIKQEGGIITEEDLADYSVIWQEAVSTDIGHEGDSKLTYLAAPLPSSGVFTNYAMKIFDNGTLQGSSIVDPDSLSFIITGFKFAFAQRSNCGDPSNNASSKSCKISSMFEDDALKKVRAEIKAADASHDQDLFYWGAEYDFKEDFGGASVVVYANGDAVSVTSSLNSLFGCKFVSQSTGILLNNELDSFSLPDNRKSQLPPTPANFIGPGKRAMSSMSPTIVLNNQGLVQMVIGSSGGTRIITSTARVMIINIIYGRPVKYAVDSPRIHHQLYPLTVFYEDGIPEDTITKMSSGDPYCYSMQKEARASGISIITRKNKDTFQAYSDWYLNGACDGY
uniref:Gamma-glutamyltranspeptidase 1 n=1 Tax=Nilaparvata lugens TaxID=108931 RepID=A0A191UR44_NILLU|nr:gamma-glutamyltranspeptidase 1 [Nilaparvata lugens]